jgi:hypothetical protein
MLAEDAGIDMEELHGGSCVCGSGLSRDRTIIDRCTGGIKLVSYEYPFP